MFKAMHEHLLGLLDNEELTQQAYKAKGQGASVGKPNPGKGNKMKDTDDDTTDDETEEEETEEESDDDAATTQGNGKAKGKNK